MLFFEILKVLTYFKWWWCELIRVSGMVELLADDVMLAIFFIYLFVADTCLYVLPRYEGLSEVFLSCPVPKLLLLAGTDRLDRYIPLVSLYKRQLVWGYAVLSWLTLILFLPLEGRKRCYSVWDDLFRCFLTSRQLTIGQMQGKFQMIVVRHTGHAIQVLFLYSQELDIFCFQSSPVVYYIFRNWFCFPCDGLSNQW